MTSAACLIGNGLSVAYSNDLSVVRLTEAMADRFTELGATDAERALAGIAEDLGQPDPGGFEQLLGPLESLSRAIWGLPGLVALSQQPGLEVANSGAQVAEFARSVHRVGLAIVLGYVADHSVGIGGGQFENTVMRVCRRLVEGCEPDAGLGDLLTIATLNYDGLLTSALTSLHEDGICELSDLGHGLHRSHRSVTEGIGPLVESWDLRTFDDLIGDTHLLHLHGSLGWLADPRSNQTWKFDLQSLRSLGGLPESYWDRLLQGQTTVVPKVVLTDQKARAIAEWPFSLAYAIFEERLIASDRWLIGGYGFGDRPINEVLRRARRERQRKGLGAPKVLLVGRSPHIEHRAVDVIGPAGYLTNTGGFPGAVDSPLFGQWLDG